MSEINILLASYNGEKFISQQIDSILAQSFQDFNIIIRDDGSQDRTPEIIDSYARKYPDKIIIIHDKAICKNPTKNFFQLIITHNDKPEVKERCKKLSYAVSSKKNEIDSLLLRIIMGWRPERVDIVDRTILRLMIFEGFIMKSLPVKSAMSEAKKLANSFGTKESSRFVSGVMFKASKFLEAEALRELESTFEK